MMKSCFFDFVERGHGSTEWAQRLTQVEQSMYEEHTQINDGTLQHHIYTRLYLKSRNSASLHS